MKPCGSDLFLEQRIVAEIDHHRVKTQFGPSTEGVQITPVRPRRRHTVSAVELRLGATGEPSETRNPGCFSSMVDHLHDTGRGRADGCGREFPIFPYIGSFKGRTSKIPSAHVLLSA